jgi:hypothetical protein|tara:strand:- start:3115 stop:3723 length:609 start_codon:yes stop_codon:yes gene_type:complete
MPRSSSLTTSVLSARSLRFVDCIKIELDSGTLKYTNHYADIAITSIDGSTQDTYLTGQGYIGHSAITITGQAQPEKVDLSFDSSQLDSTANLIAPAFANGNTTGAPVTITKTAITTSSGGGGLITEVAGITYIAFKGIVDNFSIKITDRDTMLTIFCGGELANFDKTSLYGFTNTVSQSKLYPLDTGFEFSANNAANIRWEE